MRINFLNKWIAIICVLAGLLIFVNNCEKANADNAAALDDPAIARENNERPRPNINNQPNIVELPYQDRIDERTERNDEGIRSENEDPEDDNIIGEDTAEIQPLRSAPADLLNIGIEYLDSGYYREAISYFIKIQVQYGNTTEALLAALEHGRALVERAKSFHIRDDLLLARDKLLDVITHYQQFPATYSDDFIRFIITYCETSVILESIDHEIKPHLENVLLIVDNGTKDIIKAYLGLLELYANNYENALSLFHQSNNDLAQYGMILTYIALQQDNRAREICRDFLAYHKDSQYLDQLISICQRQFSCMPCYEDDCEITSIPNFNPCGNNVAPPVNNVRNNEQPSNNSNCECTYRLVSSGYVEYPQANDLKLRLNALNTGIVFAVARDSETGKFVVISQHEFSNEQARWALDMFIGRNLNIKMEESDSCNCQ